MLTLTLIMIVKNESAIIKRCLDSIKDHIDYIVISDTGSTDNTVKITENYLKDNNIEGKVYNDEWKNFGYNRTKSVLNGQEWLDEQKIDKETNYFITIDADMIIEFKESFKKENLSEKECWALCQVNYYIKYYNTRIFRSDLPFKCIGVTHEYWGCDTKHRDGKFEDIVIDDRGDGGCKSDKFDRDIKLLTKGLEDEPENYRYYFYLAQSYGDTDDVDNAIKWYKKRVKAGGWFEEIFISYKRIGELYMKKGEDEKALYYWGLGYECIPYRSETIYKICNYYREKGKNFLSLLYLKKGISIQYPKDLVLFLEYPIYEYKFLKELAIIGYYVDKKKEALLACQHLLLSKDIPNETRDETFSNNFFYIESLTNHSGFKSHNVLNVTPKKNFIQSNSCLTNSKKGYKGVVRAVNYSISDRFEYNIRDNNGCVTTSNYWAEFDNNYNIKMFYEIDCNVNKARESHIKGLEDIRICYINDKLYGLSVDWEYGRNNHPCVSLLHFEFDEDRKYYINNIIPITYNDNICQKNWTLYTENSKLYIIYSHHPLTILEINPENGEYIVVKEEYSKYNLKDIRGSANPVKINNEWLVLVHEVIHKDTRKYYHRFLKYSENWELLEVSIPFYFKNFFVEFSLSTIYNNESNDILIVYSTRDNTTEIITYDYSKIEWIPHDIKKYLISVL
jgi:glycosyltransferase involved in cell wall biosynthesis/predicted GH43/DUF377 family glycosyl hydrolase